MQQRQQRQQTQQTLSNFGLFTRQRQPQKSMRSVLETKQEKDARSCSASFFIAGNGLNALSGALITDRKRYENSNEKVTIQ